MEFLGHRGIVVFVDIQLLHSWCVNIFASRHCYHRHLHFNPTWCGVFDIRYGVWGGLKVPADKTRPLRSTEATTDATNQQILFLTSLPVCRAFDQSPMSYSFAVRGRRNDLLSPQKIIRFQYAKILTLSIFELYGEYVHQIESENILNSNLT